MRTLIENALLLNGDTAVNGCVLADGHTIAYAGPRKPLDADRRIDAAGGIVMPALYNAHTHAAMTLLRGVGSDLPLHRWLREAIFPAEEHLTPEIVYWGTMLAAAEMLRFGTAGFADMYFFMDEAARAVIDSGMRACLAWGTAIDSQLGLLKAFGDHPSGRVRIYAGIHAEYTSTPESITETTEFARQYGLPTHVHVSETREETEGCAQRRGVTPALYLGGLGAFDRGGIAAHCVYTTEEERALLKSKGMYAAHCPVSNLKLASGVFPLGNAVSAGTPVALGTDGCASNNNLNLFEELRLACMLHKGVTGDPAAISPRQAFHMATRAGALACGFEGGGLLAEGALADIILLDTSGAHCLPMADPYAHVAYSAQGSDVRMTMVSGEILYMDGQYPRMDIENIKRRALHSAGLLA